VIYR